MALSLVLLAVAAAAGSEHFSEELLLSPLQSGQLSAHFKFTTRHPGDLRTSHDWAHYGLLARPLGEVLATYRVQELDLSLTQGLWRVAAWGYPVEASPPGAAVTARFLPQVAEAEVDDMWEGLTSALAGLLCASLNKLDRTTGVAPRHSFQPTGAQGANLSSSPTRLRYGLLPKENLCTENLSPWKKLLPCKGRRGLATLLNSGPIQRGASYQALILKVRPVCSSPACTTLATEVSQSIALVFDPAVYNGRPDSTDWSIKQLFGIGLAGACPVADNSQVFVDVSGRAVELSPAPHREVTAGSGTNTRTFAAYSMAAWAEEGKIRNLAGHHPARHVYGMARSPVLTASSFLTGTGQERGGLTTELRNAGPEPVTVVLLQVVPWYLRLFLHTLSVTTTDGRTLLPAATDYRPARDRARPHLLELVLVLPPRSTVSVAIQFERCLLRWVEYPPDANHGFYVPSATVTARLRDNRNISVVLSPEDGTMAHSLWGNPATGEQVIHLYTETLLVSLPTPDFSMPYNVICLACTVAALAFGPIHNITTKSLELVQPGEEELGLLGKVMARLRAKVDAIKAKFGKKVVVEEEKEEEKKATDSEEDEEEKKDK